MPYTALDFIDNELQSLKERGLYRQLRVLEGEQRAVATFDGQSVINLSSNNYLGLTSHPRLRQSAVQATMLYGVGSGSVRTIAGTMTVHEDLERKLTAFKKTEASVLFQSGFAANIGVIGSLIGEGDVIISDESNHASIIDGARLTKAARRIYKHRDLESLRQALDNSKEFDRKLVVTDGVFSMDGDIAPLPGIVELTEEYGAISMVDDAHASGVLGSHGRGTIDHFRLHGRVDVQVGTLSKAIGVLGGYVAGSRRLRELIIHKARPILFSTSHPPAVAATCLTAIDVIENEPHLIDTLWENTRYFKAGLRRLGFDTGVSETPITPVIVGRGDLAMQLSDRLFEKGVFAQGVSYPTVPEEKSRVRTIVTATHSRENLDAALEAFEQAGLELGII